MWAFRIALLVVYALAAVTAGFDKNWTAIVWIFIAAANLHSAWRWEAIADRRGDLMMFRTSFPWPPALFVDEDGDATETRGLRIRPIEENPTIGNEEENVGRNTIQE